MSVHVPHIADLRKKLYPHQLSIEAPLHGTNILSNID
jgi:hypothetical protein